MGADFYLNPPREEAVPLSQQVAKLERDRKDLIESNIKLRKQLGEAFEFGEKWRSKYENLLKDLKRE